ncbi:3-keto-disaccharide hydrolase [Gimesia maris]|uniref:3-keto-disaccharide hydrolase n=1 Tax=Gimesia maris TaxID=122 RepID=UPI0032EBA2C4
MKQFSICALSGCCALFLFTHLGHADSKSPKWAATNVKQAGPDFQKQGEYSGTIGAGDEALKYGVQVIALGNGEFEAVGYPGGLPGDGWKQEEKVKAKGESRGGVISFVSEHGRGELGDEEMTLFDSEGNEVGVLDKVYRKSPTLGKKAPEGATVLFDSDKAEQTVKNFENGQITEEGLLKEGVTSKKKFKDGHLHLEFQLPFMPQARGQGRSNSGCYVLGRYEVQILDSFGLEGKDNECGGIYKLGAPSVNMCFPPLAWQTYDIDFQSAKYDKDGNKTAKARITVKHNGVTVQDDQEINEPTPGGTNKDESIAGPLFLQNHSNPVRFRNIWVVEK